MARGRHMHTMSYLGDEVWNAPVAHHQSPQVFSRPIGTIQEGDQQGDPSDVAGNDVIIPVPFISYGVYGIMLKIFCAAYSGGGAIDMALYALDLDHAQYNGPTIREDMAEFYALSDGGSNPTLSDVTGSTISNTLTCAVWCSPHAGRSYGVDTAGDITYSDKVRLVNDLSSDGNGSDDIPYSLTRCDMLGEARNLNDFDESNLPAGLGVGIDWSELTTASYSAYNQGTLEQHILVQPYDGMVL